MFLMLAAYLVPAAWGQAPLSPTTSVPAESRFPPAPDLYYGAWVLTPPLVTIVLALVLRQVVPALVVGVLIAACMLVPCLPPEAAFGGGVIGGVRLALERYLLGALARLDPDTGRVDYGHLKILVFTLLIGGMVGVIAANGGTKTLVDRVARWASTRRRGQLVGWLAGILVFFDDYASAMIVGPALRPVTDRLRISRAKLAYIVDSTAAPISSIALIGTWVGAEVGYIDAGLQGLSNRPAFLADVSAYSVFLASIPYRFYAILALVMVFWIGLLGRDFGPMRKAEEAAPPAADDTPPPGPTSQPQRGHAWYAVVPVLVLVVATLGLLVATGWPAAPPGESELPGSGPRWFRLAQQIVSDADPYNSILYGAVAALLVAAGISLATRALSLGRTVDSATEAMSRLLPTLIVLVLAWSLSDAIGDLKLGEVARTLLKQYGLAATWLPLLVFISACIVSFATGTSWGTMGILCPATITVAAGVLADLPPAEARTLFYAAVGSVLAGAVFGDHCSPISDTTVLSALASQCSLEQHVWTQMPYALTVAAVSALSGEVLCRQCQLAPWVGLLTGAALLFLITLLLGRPAARVRE